MAFAAEEPRTPDTIGDISITVTDFVDPEKLGDIEYSIQILQSTGSIFRVATGNLGPHLTQGQIDALIGFMATIRTQAENELLP